MKSLLTLTFLLVAMLTAFAQSNTGRLIGTVLGPDGVLPGATVKVTDNQTSKERTVTTSSDGTFLLPQLDPGNYTVVVAVSGFKSYTANNVKIEVGQDYSLQIPLEIGQTQDSVTVTAGVDLLNNSNAQISNTITKRQILELPLNGRDPTSLLLLQAGVANNGAQNVSVNGQRSTFTNITRDGINIQDNHIRQNASTFSVERPNVDDVSEFTVTTQNAGADLGYGASQLQMVTPRGQNNFHGGLFLYNRNSVFSANRYFNNASGTALPFLNRNQFGGTISGPIYKNKLFFFGAYEGFRQRTQSTQTRTLLTPNARQGLFTYVDNTPAAQGGPVTRTVSLFSLLPASANIPGINSVIQTRILDKMPATGNAVDRGDGRITTGYRFNQRSNSDRDKYTGRFDYNINDRHTVNGVFSYTDERLNDRPDVDSPQGFAAVPVFNQPSTREFLALAYRWTPSARFTNEVRAGAFLSDPVFVRRTDEPAFFITLPLINNPEVTTQNQGRNTGNYSYQDNADWQVGNHAIRFGGQWQVFTDFTFAKFSTLPTYTLGTSALTPTLTASNFTGGISNAQLGTANSLLALLGGIITSSTQTFNVETRTSGYVGNAPAAYNYRWDVFSGYVTDQWRIRPNFTLNYGLRYELFTPLRELQGLALEPVIPAGKTVREAVLDPNGRVDFINGYGNNKLNKTDKNNFAPVVSFAWTPNFNNRFFTPIFGQGKTVFRGGFRVSYVNDEILRSQDSSQQTNVGLSTAVTNNALNARVNAPPPITAPPFKMPRTFAENNAISGNFAPIFAIDPNYQIARSDEYNFGLQRELGWGTALEIRYVGGRSNNLPRGIDYNRYDMIKNGFLADFLRARNNLLLTNNPVCTTAQNPGCQPLTVFPLLPNNGFVTNPTVINFLRDGTPQALIGSVYVGLGLEGGFPFRPNPNGGVISVLTNGAMYNYNSLQAEVRKRFSNGLQLQANYTFQKTLTNASGTDQFKFNVNLDNDHPEWEYQRADYDQTHIFNFNGIYELPFGSGKKWLNQGGWVNRVFGGFQMTSIVNVGTGAPITFVDARGTWNRASQSGRQTPQTNLSKSQIKDLVGIFKTNCGVYYINPSVINLNQQTCTGTGRATEGLGSTPFAGQVFFNNGPGQTGTLERAFINGPLYVNWDFGMIKNVQVTETSRLQFRVEAFNVLNRANFAVTTQSGANSIFDVNSTTFGRISGTFAPRIVQLVGRFEF
ncbi:MAG TPA: TonB-dependent receptor [Blastocatellia bacterium]|nr:TonB-dependent receptor [Blastocatellia bacterium]